MNYWLLLIPILSAFTGWVTIRVAIWLLFRPLQQKNIFGIRVRGAWPANQERIASLAGEYAASLIDASSIQQQVSQPSNFDEIRPLIEEHMDHFLKHKLQQQMPMIAMFIGDKTIAQLKTIFIQEIELLFPQVIGRFAGKLGDQMNIRELVAQKMRLISTERMEAAFNAQFGPALKKAGFGGMIIGLFIGFIQLLIVLLV